MHINPILIPRYPLYCTIYKYYKGLFNRLFITEIKNSLSLFHIIKLKKKKKDIKGSVPRNFSLSYAILREKKKKFFPTEANEGSSRVDKSKVNRSSVVGTGRKLELPVAREINVRDTYTRPRCRCTMFRGIVTHS